MDALERSTTETAVISKLRASVVIVTYNSAKYIDRCLESVLSNNPFEVMVVDNSSIDDTVERIQNKFPGVTIIENDVNVGYGSAVNIGVEGIRGDLLVVLNPDTMVEEGWLDNLINPIGSIDKAIVVPRIMVYDGTVINTCGNLDHFTGLSFTNGFGKNAEDMTDPLSVSGISGACFAIMKEDFLQLGGFDKDFFLYMEDAELSWRAHANGYSFIYAPRSVVYHDYKLNVNAEKLFRLENGRYYLLRKFLTNKDLVSIGPSLLMTELLSWGYAIKLGRSGITYKTKTLKHWFSNPRSVQQVEYQKFLMKFDDKIPTDQLCYGFLDAMVKRWANTVFVANYRILTK